MEKDYLKLILWVAHFFSAFLRRSHPAQWLIITPLFTSTAVCCV